MLREDGQGRGGNEPPPTTRATGTQGAGDRANESIGGLRTAAQPRPHQGMATDNGSARTPTRHTTGADGARPEHVKLVRREYGLLVPTGTRSIWTTRGDLGSGGFESLQGTNTPGVAELPREDKIPK